MLSFHNKNTFRTGKYHSFILLGAALLSLVLVSSSRVLAQLPYWNTTTGLLQGERVARVTMLYDDTLRASTVTTSWLPFGTHLSNHPEERGYAPTRFTLFVVADTTNVPHASGPEVTVTAQLALNDTTGYVYEQADGSLELAPSSGPITTSLGQVFPVPIYGGGWIRFVVTSADSARVRLDFWRIR